MGGTAGFVPCYMDALPFPDVALRCIPRFVYISNVTEHQLTEHVIKNSNLLPWNMCLCVSGGRGGLVGWLALSGLFGGHESKLHSLFFVFGRGIPCVWLQKSSQHNRFKASEAGQAALRVSQLTPGKLCCTDSEQSREGVGQRWSEVQIHCIWKGCTSVCGHNSSSGWQAPCTRVCLT